MRVIVDIAKAELRRLFFSPVAFLLLVILAFLMGSIFIDATGLAFFGTFLGYETPGVSTMIFATPAIGFYDPLLRYIYLFFPILTMNIMSRDIGSGAFKLMQSSPVKDRQIVFGKYLSMVVFNLLLAGLIYLFSLYALFAIDNVEVPLSLSGLLGIFLLCCAYSAIGLFMSSITGLPIIAAIGTLCVLVFLNYTDNVWQEYPIVRDITYWLSLKGRAKVFYKGMITSEDVIYFLAVIAFFISVTIIRLRNTRIRRSKLQVFGHYSLAVLLLCVVGYITSMPQFKAYLDVTRTKANTLSRESQKVVAKMDGGLKITTYTNLFEPNNYFSLPKYQKRDIDRYEDYTRFKPEIKMDYVYYYKTMPGHAYEKFKGKSDDEIMDTVRKLFDIGYKVVPYNEIKDKIDLSPEEFRTVSVVERDNGQKTILRTYDDALRYPEEREITAAFKRLAERLPRVGFVTGHGERTNNMGNDRGYSLFAQEKRFRFSLLNNGFDFEEVSLMAPVPDHIDILVIADARKEFTETENLNYNRYIQKGGNLMILGEPGRENIMNKIGEPLGISFLPGAITHSTPDITQDVLVLKHVKTSKWDPRCIKALEKNGLVIMMSGANAIKADNSKGFTLDPLFTSDSTGTWTELETKDLSFDTAVFNPDAGEQSKPFVTILAMERKINGRSQKIMVTGDADWINNGEVVRSRKNYNSGNFTLISRIFYWLSENSVPIDTSKDPHTDNKVLVKKESWKRTVLTMQWLIPALLLAGGLLTWIRRKGR